MSVRHLLLSPLSVLNSGDVENDIGRYSTNYCQHRCRRTPNYICKWVVNCNAIRKYMHFSECSHDCCISFTVIDMIDMVAKVLWSLSLRDTNASGCEFSTVYHLLLSGCAARWSPYMSTDVPHANAPKMSRNCQRSTGDKSSAHSTHTMYLLCLSSGLQALVLHSLLVHGNSVSCC